MLYDGSNPLHARQAEAYVRKLIDGQKVFEVTEIEVERNKAYI